VSRSKVELVFHWEFYRQAASCFLDNTKPFPSVATGFHRHPAKVFNMSSSPDGPIPNPAASEHLPYFVVAPGDSDRMFIMVTLFVIVMVILAGVFYFKLHSIPEQIAHDKRAGQVQLISILTILALFTHNNAFWVAALVLATISVPNFLAPVRSIARSLRRMSIAEEKKNV
jgi:hypothetical protein